MLELYVPYGNQSWTCTLSHAKNPLLSCTHTHTCTLAEQVFPSAAYYKPEGNLSSSSLRVVLGDRHVFCAMFDGVCGSEAASLCRAHCYEVFSGELEAQRKGPDYVRALTLMFHLLDAKIMDESLSKPVGHSSCCMPLCTEQATGSFQLLDASKH